VTVLVKADGEPFDLGRRHGAALAGRLRAFVDDSVCRLGLLLPGPVTLGALRPTIAAYRAAIWEATPRLAEELDGLAAGAALELDAAWLLQLRREILGYSKTPAAGDCTTYARASGALLAQTVDLNGNLDDQISVLDVASPIGRSLVLSFAGLLGYLGLNSHGLAIGLNLVLGGDWRPGLPPYLAIRHLLDTTATVEEALGVLQGLRLASSRSLTLCDRESVACVEILGDEMRVVRSGETVHTNHFLHPDLTARDEINVFSRNSSVRRLEAAMTGLARVGADPEEHFRLLSTPPIRVPDTGDIRRERTVAAVVLRPALGELWLRPGDPSVSATQIFRL
jgi:hypothetical protein